MNTKKLIRTPTAGMSREDWLDFRKPITHVLKFIKEHNKGFDNNDVFEKQNEMYYLGLVEFFKSQTWDDFIFPCIGASEMGTVVGANKWKSSVELFYEKLGLKPGYEEENAAMFWGKQLEKEIAEKWQYWDGSIEGMIENYNAGKILRKCRNVNFYLQNVDCPWIFASLDRIINKTGQQKEGALECKTIAGYYAQQWESGTPLEYIVQIQTQIGVTEFEYGELAILIDGRQMQVLPFDYNKNIWENLQSRSLVFFERIKKAIAYYILSKLCSDIMKPQYIAGIDRLSPDPDGSISLENYLKENIPDNGFEINGGEIELRFAKRHELLKGKIKILLDQKRLCSNYLKTEMKDASVMKFSDLDEGRITWRKNKRARPFKILVKVPEVEYETLEELTKPEVSTEEKIKQIKNLPLP